MDRAFLYWRDELARDADNGLVEIDCSKKNKEKFVKTIMSMFTTMDEYFVKNGLYKYNNYYKFLDQDFMDNFDYELLYPRFMQDNNIGNENLDGACEIGEDYYNDIKISKNNLFDKPTICHEFIHYLTLNNFYHNHKKDGRFKVFLNSALREHHLIFKKKHMTKSLSLGEEIMQENQFFIEGLTQYLTEQIYPADKGSVYVSQVQMMSLFCDLIGKQNILQDFLQGNISSIENFFDAKTWEGKYVGNFADFMNFIEGYTDNYNNANSYYLFREINKNYKGAISCITKAYYQNLLKDDKKHSNQEFLRLFEYIVDYAALPECYETLKQIVKSGKIEKIEDIKDKINKMSKSFSDQYQDCKLKVGLIEVEIIYAPDAINFVLNLGEKNKLNIRFDGVDGFAPYTKNVPTKVLKPVEQKINGKKVKYNKVVDGETEMTFNSSNQHSRDYLQAKARATKFADGTKPKDMSIELESNFAKVIFYDKDGKEFHIFGINYGHKKNIMFDDNVVDLSYDNLITQKDEIL